MATDPEKLLIRLELKITQICTNQKMLQDELEKVKTELASRVCLLHTNQIENLNHNFNASTCSRHAEKLKTLEKLTWAAIVTAIGLVLKSFWSAVST